MEALMIPDHLEDWKLNRNVECRITLKKLKIETPEFGTMEFCRTLTNTTKDMDFDFKSEFVLDVLLNDILRKCDEKCGLCEEYVQQLRQHITQAHSTSPEAQTVFKCDICNSIYSSPSMLIRHRNTHSDTLTTTPCTYKPAHVRFDSRTNECVSSGQCEIHPHQPVPVPPMNVEWIFLKQESSQSELEISNPNPPGILQHMNHLSTIENNLKQECDVFECQDELRDPLILQDVDLQVASFVKYEYEYPGISTESASEGGTVLRHVTREKSSNDTNPQEEEIKGTTCGKGSPFPSDLITHKITQSSKKPQHSCDICGKCFSRSYYLTQHKLTHSGNKAHSCGVCGKCFTLNSHLTQHRLTHTGEKPFRCDECGRGFALKSNLRKHKLTHTGERTHKCDVCGMCFGQRFILTRHKLTHTGEKPFCCEVCGRGFALVTYLTNHKLVHTGERPHKCDVCEKSFKQSAHLAKHKLTHTGVTGEKSFHCDECGQNFYSRHEIAKHKLKHAWQSTTTTLVNHLKEERESEEEGCQEDPLLNLEV